MSEAHFEQLVAENYAALYRFALSLARSETEARDLVQQTFYRWATRGYQLKDTAKAKTWLFTTLHRDFLRGQRRLRRFPHNELEESQTELPMTLPEVGRITDADTVVAAIAEIDEIFRAPVVLFYLEDLSYAGIAEVMGIPMGTVKSRISRGLAQLFCKLTEPHPVERSSSEPNT
ncbi:MAG: RNA polymerase sigma factor [Verrucomicrobia bacterium]|nr:RNA polymerase sigma factor [Verrucomicrobiota bacterium]MBI3868306.1 RNA polymerase sigma factor [Verrucomicrobiota bacterium]